MKKFVLFFLLCISINAQTTLGTGDIAFVGINSDGDDDFAFLLLKDISAGTVIKITDKGWNDATGFYTVVGDGIWQWTTSGSLTAGTVIYIKTSNNGVIEPGSLAATPGTVTWVEGEGGTVLSYTGDQVFLYQGTEASPTIITGIHYNVETGSTSDNWDGNASSTQTSALPDQLTNGTNAIWVYAAGPSEQDDFRYNGVVTSGNAATLNAAINNVSNWSKDNTTAYTLNPYPYSFTVTASAPTSQATNIICSGVQETQMNVAWTNGNGSKRAVFMKEGTGAITNPSDNVTYTASSNWSSKGTQLEASGYYCIYNGTGTNVTVTNLTSYTEYSIQVFEFNGSAGGELYNTSTASGNPSSQTSLPVELTTFNASPFDNYIQLNWQTATEVNNYGFEVERSDTPLLFPSREGKEQSDRGVWETIGFVEGHGNSSSPKQYSFVDKDIAGGSYMYRLKQIDTDGSFTYSKEVTVETRRGESLPQTFELYQNYPNPFNPTTTIKYSIPALTPSLSPRERVSEGQVRVTLKIYDILGNEVSTLVNEAKEPGVYEVEFNASNLPSGIYFYRIAIHSDKLSAGGFVQTNKMLLIK